MPIFHHTIPGGFAKNASSDSLRPLVQSRSSFACFYKYHLAIRLEYQRQQRCIQSASLGHISRSSIPLAPKEVFDDLLGTQNEAFDWELNDLTHTSICRVKRYRVYYSVLELFLSQGVEWKILTEIQ